MDFISSAIIEALSAIQEDLQLSAPHRAELDHDVKGEIGWAEVVRTIFLKIDSSAAFIADATPTLKSLSGKHSLNPNVLIELGYAMKALGAQHIVLIWNVADGVRPEELPFDIRHRLAPISYSLNKTASTKRRNAEKAKLVEKLKSALAPILKLALVKQDNALKFKLQDSRQGDPSIWLRPGEMIEGYELWGKENGWTRFHVVEAPRSYVRIVPYEWEGSIPNAKRVEDLCNDTWRLSPLYSPAREDSGWASNSLGGVSIYDCEHPFSETFSSTQWFEKNGEAWTFDASIVEHIAGRRSLDGARILTDWRNFIETALEFYSAVRSEFPFTLPLRIELGLFGIEKALWEKLDADQSGTPNTTVAAFSRDGSFSYVFFVRHLENFGIELEFQKISDELRKNFGLPALSRQG